MRARSCELREMREEGGLMSNAWIGTVVAGQMDRFFGAVGTDLPWEDPQIRYRLGTDNYEGRYTDDRD
jgi:hypothetical protein